MSSASGEASGFASMATNSAEEGGNSTVKKKRNLPGTPDPDAEVIALSPKTLMATNRFSCEVCGKGFQRDQNLQLHRRGHNLPWKLKQRVDGIEVKKKVYVCPEISCVHHDPSRALGDLTGIKKHFSRKHGEKKWKCEKCSKRYAVHSDWKAHQKVCGTREYRCDCGTLFSRRDSFITHRAFCDALAEESARATTVHKQVEIQQQQQSSSGGHNDETNTLSGPMRGPGDLSNTAIDAPSTPRSHNEVSDPSVKLAFEPNPPSSVSPTWRIQDGREKAYKPSKGPALSLCLGTGPGPGPPGLACLAESNPNPISMPVTNPSSWTVLQDTNPQARPPLADGNLGIFTSMLTSGNNDPEQQVYGVGPSNGISDLPMNPGVMLENSSPIPRFSLPSGGGGGTIMSPSYFRNPSKPSSHHRHHTSSGQMPATALLQKAAMMGATASNPYLLRNFGIRGTASPMVSSGSGQDSWAGPTLSSSSSWRGYAPLSSTQQGGAAHHSYDYGAYRQGGDSLRTPVSYDGQLGSVEDSSMNSRSALFADVSYSSRNARSFTGDSNWRSDMLLGTTSKVPNNPTPTPMVGLESPLGREKNEGDRTTLDFLGVGSHGGKDGLTGSIPHQRMPGVSSSYPGTTKTETTREGTPKY